jgi:hypothetical protein
MLLLISITEHADDIEHSRLGCGDAGHPLRRLDGVAVAG